MLALEQSLPMYIVDPTRRGECVGAVKRLLPARSEGEDAADPERCACAPRARSCRPCDTARSLACELGFRALDQTKIATAVSELARNILLYVGDGEVTVSAPGEPRRGIEIVASDAGKGIPDVARVMDAEYRSRTGMGKGLKGTKRLMDHLDIVTRPGAGTTGNRAEVPAMIRVASGTCVRPFAGEDVAGDACLVEPWSRGVLVAVTDGLGHGPAAAEASRALVRRARRDRDAAGADLRRRAPGLLKTRGAVAAIARFDEGAGKVEVAGIGNVTTRLLAGRVAARPCPGSGRRAGRGVPGGATAVVRLRGGRPAA